MYYYIVFYIIYAFIQAQVLLRLYLYDAQSFSLKPDIENMNQMKENDGIRSLICREFYIRANVQDIVYG